MNDVHIEKKGHKNEKSQTNDSLMLKGLSISWFNRSEGTDVKNQPRHCNKGPGHNQKHHPKHRSNYERLGKPLQRADESRSSVLHRLP